ncbi:MAG: thermonuclease family protein [Proteobacteria bacterium]|nr:thermonuclease family protein [Pseudomonadota bacterium]
MGRKSIQALLISFFVAQGLMTGCDEVSDEVQATLEECLQIHDAICNVEGDMKEDTSGSYACVKDEFGCLYWHRYAEGTQATPQPGTGTQNPNNQTGTQAPGYPPGNPNDQTGTQNPNDQTGTQNPNDQTGTQNPNDQTGTQNPNDQTGTQNPNDQTGTQNPNDQTGTQNPQQCENACNEGDLRCSDREVQVCAVVDGCTQWVTKETCSGTCSNNACVTNTCNPQCEVGASTCYGKRLKKCVADNDGCPRWQDVKTCSYYCMADPGVCKEDLPTCKIKPGSKASILQWTDGDTLWLRAVSDGTCNDYEYTADSKGVYKWRNVRYDVRVLGIDAPECTKERNNYYYYTCVPDSNYTNKNERMGYEAWVAAEKLVPYKSDVIIGCDTLDSDGTCSLDTTDSRYVAYIGYSKDNASYDFSTELTRQGLAFANVEFASTTKKIGDICAAQKEAINAKIGIWSLGETSNDALNMMGKSKRYKLKNVESRCSKYIKK